MTCCYFKNIIYFSLETPMPKETFLNLNPEKKAAIDEALFKEFTAYPLHEAAVKHIVEDLGISRGSFYQYFKSLEESYFYILDKETNSIHTHFLNHLVANSFDVFKALDSYGEAIVNEVFTDERYQIYKNRFLYWNPSLEQQWRDYISKTPCIDIISYKKQYTEAFSFIRAILHSLIERIFVENLTTDEFLEIYKKNIDWIKGGVKL